MVASALALVATELVAMRSHHSDHQYHNFEQMVANRLRVLGIAGCVELAVDGSRTMMKLICVDQSNKSIWVRDVMANLLVLDSFQPLMQADFDVIVASMSCFASEHHVGVDFVDSVTVDVVPMMMVVIDSAYAMKHDDAYVMDYPILCHYHTVD